MLRNHETRISGNSQAAPEKMIKASTPLFDLNCGQTSCDGAAVASLGANSVPTPEKSGALEHSDI